MLVTIAWRESDVKASPASHLFGALVWLFFGGRWLELTNMLKDSGKMGKMGKLSTLDRHHLRVTERNSQRESLALKTVEWRVVERQTLVGKS